MRSRWTAVVVSCALLACLLAVPAGAAAAVAAPQLTAPAASANGFTTGESMKFEWNGALQGDMDTLDRSFFRLEVIDAKEAPAGAQAVWPVGKLENYVQTEPGSAETSITLGVPMAGEYRWRVCAWGVVDDIVNNVLEQLPGGCSASRTFTTVAVPRTRGAIGELPIQTRRQVDGGVRTVYVERPGPVDEPEEVAPEPEPQAPVQEVAPEPAPQVQEVTRRDVAEEGAALDLGGDGSLQVDAAADRGGVGGALMTGLGMQLPFLPIPFWTLAILIACVPIARIWRRNVQAMFVWPDGSADGRGTPLHVVDPLQDAADAPGLQVRSKIADGAAESSAAEHPHPSARQAA